jgi:alkaline phosphatase D
MPITRRAMLGLLSSSTFFLTSPSARVGAAELPVGAPVPGFPQGVASGDPQPDAVMLWTRALPRAPLDKSITVPVLLQLSRSDDFASVLLEAQLETARDSDYTVRAYIDGLAPDTTYYYRFLGAGGAMSRLGRTRTAPAPGQERTVNLAFASCQSFEQGYYGSWARMLADDTAAPAEEQIQFVLHLGDFIYERCWYQRSDGSAQSRHVSPFPRGVQTEDNHYAQTLADYRHLYQTYLSDPHLQAARARWPFICIWDDHEFSDNNFQGYSTYGGVPRLEAHRRKVANKAWFEYIPTVLGELVDQPAHDFTHLPIRGDGDDEADNQAAIDSLCIYRKLNWGKNLDIVLTDNRSYRSGPCIPEGLAASLGLPLNTVQLVEIADAGRAYADGNPPATLPYGDHNAPNPWRERAPGSCLGLTQRNWLLDQLQASTARWKLWGNSLPLLPLRLDMSSLPLAGYQDSIFTIDGWMGYPHELGYLMQQLQDRGIGAVVSLSGDHHMHGAGSISRSASEPDASAVMVDFNVAGISSAPLLDELVVVAGKDHPAFRSLVTTRDQGRDVPVWNMTMLDGVTAALAYTNTGLKSLARRLGPNQANPGLKFVDSNANGYGLARFSAGELQVQLVTMSDVRTPLEKAPAIAYIARFSTAHWQPQQHPVLLGPTFDRGAPFPFEPPTV